MSFATFWIEDAFTPIVSLPGFIAGPTVDWDELAEINHLSHAEVMDGQVNGHRPYVARMYGQPVAYGWLAKSKVSIGELDINVDLPCQKDLVFMKELLESGKVVPVIDGCYPLSKTAEAFQYYEKVHARGKIVITVEHDNKP